MSKHKNKLLLAIAFCILWSWLVVSRYRSGNNYLPLHVKLVHLDESVADINVTTRSIWGSTGQLAQSKVDPTVWLSTAEVAAIHRVIVNGNGLTSPSQVKIEARVGSNWQSPSRVLKQAGEPTLHVNEEPNQQANLEFAVSPFSASLLTSPSKAINWSGDLALLMVPLLQSALVVAFWVGSFFAYRCIRCTSMSATNHQLQIKDSPSRLGAWASPLVWCLCAVILGSHLFGQLSGVLQAKVVTEFYALLAVTIAVGTILWIHALWIAKAGSEPVPMVITFATIFVIKLCWVFSFDTVQTADYGIYWRFGILMADGDWSYFSRGNPLQTILVERAFMYTYWVAKYVGKTPLALELSNVAIQMATLGIYYFLARRFFGWRTALIALPILTIFSEFWFAPTVATHDIPGMFWLAFIFASFEILRSLVVATERTFARQFTLVAVAAGVVGLATAFLDLQRGFGPFVLVAIAAYLTIRCLLFSTPSAKIFVVYALCLVVVFAVMTGTKRMVHSHLTQRIGEMGTTSTLAYLTAVEAKTAGHYDEMQPWRFLYFPAVPDHAKPDFIVRKLIHEKIASGWTFWRHLAERNSITGQAGAIIIMAFGGVEDVFMPNGEQLAWPYLKYRFSIFIQILLLSGALLRIVFIRRFPISEGELFPLVFTSTSYLVLLLATEVNAPYDTFLGFTLAWSTAMIIHDLVSRDKSIGISKNAEMMLKPSFVLKGILGIVCIFVTHLSLAAIANGKNLGFERLAPEANEGKWVRVGDGSEVLSSGEAIAIRFEEDQALIERGKRIETDLCLSCEAEEGVEVRFFVSGNQRKYKVSTKDMGWDEAPVKFQVMFEDKVVHEGRLSDLHVPRFVSVPVPKKVNNAKLTMSLLADSDLIVDRMEHLPTIAIEYLHIKGK